MYFIPVPYDLHSSGEAAFAMPCVCDDVILCCWASPGDVTLESAVVEVRVDRRVSCGAVVPLYCGTWSEGGGAAVGEVREDSWE